MEKDELAAFKRYAVAYWRMVRELATPPAGLEWIDELGATND